MIFGRKKQNDVDPVDESPELDDELAHERSTDEWSELDERDWREDGPFDISEVDLEADEVARLDLGSLILTPFEGMQLQLQVEESTQQINAILVTKEESGIEVALFAAPKASSMLADVRRDMVADTESSGGTANIAEGPYGAEIRRVLPVQGPNGEQLLHVSRTWFVEGPRWLLRGVLLGKAAQLTEFEAEGLDLYEFFANIVVRRGNQPLAAGDLIPMTLPEGIG